MADLMIAFDTPDGPMMLPAVQVYAIGRIVQAYREEGAEPTWHLNECGECVGIHLRGDHSGSGFVVDADGGVTEYRDGAPFYGDEGPQQ